MSRSPQRRAYAPTVKTERVEYTRERDGKVFTIQAGNDGGYLVFDGDRLVLDRLVQAEYYGRPKWGSKKLFEQAVSEAEAAIEGLT